MLSHNDERHGLNGLTVALEDDDYVDGTVTNRIVTVNPTSPGSGAIES